MAFGHRASDQDLRPCAGRAIALLGTPRSRSAARSASRFASTVAATHFTTLTHAGATAPTALTGGFQWALWVCGAIGLAAIPVTFLLIRCDDLAGAAGAADEEEPALASAA